MDVKRDRHGRRRIQRFDAGLDGDPPSLSLAQMGRQTRSLGPNDQAETIGEWGLGQLRPGRVEGNEGGVRNAQFHEGGPMEELDLE